MEPHINGFNDASQPIPPTPTPQKEVSSTDRKIGNLSANVPTDIERDEPLFNTEYLSKELELIEASLLDMNTIIDTSSDIEKEIPDVERDKKPSVVNLHQEKATDIYADRALKEVLKGGVSTGRRSTSSEMSSEEISLKESEKLTLKDKASRLLDKFKSRVSELKEKFPNLPKPTFPAFKTNLTFQIKFPNFTPIKEYLKNQAQEIKERFTTTDKDKGLYYKFNEGGRKIVDAISDKLSEGISKIKKEPYTEESKKSSRPNSRSSIRLTSNTEGLKEVARLNSLFNVSSELYRAVVDLYRLVPELEKAENKDKKLKFEDDHFVIYAGSIAEGKSAKRAFSALLTQAVNLTNLDTINTTFELYQLLDRLYASPNSVLSNLVKDDDEIAANYYKLETKLSKLVNKFEEPLPEKDRKMTLYIFSPNRQRTFPEPKEN